MDDLLLAKEIIGYLLYLLDDQAKEEFYLNYNKHTVEELLNKDL